MEEIKDDGETMAEYWADVGPMMKEESRKKKKKNLDWSTNRLKKLGIFFKSHNDGIHLEIMHNSTHFDFWPSTGKYKNRRTGEYKRGIRNLLKEIERGNECQPKNN